MKTNMLSDFHICISVSLFWMGLLGAAHRKELKAPSPPPLYLKCYTYPTIIKLDTPIPY